MKRGQTRWRIVIWAEFGTVTGAEWLVAGQEAVVVYVMPGK